MRHIRNNKTIFFGTPAKVGLPPAGIPRDEVINIRSEEVIKNLLTEIEGRSEEDKTKKFEHQQNIKNPELNKKFELQIGSITELEIQQSKFYLIFAVHRKFFVAYEERIICNQCSTVTIRRKCKSKRNLP